MFLALFTIVCLAVFPVQMLLCFRCPKRWIKLVPLVSIVVVILGCLFMAYYPVWIFSGEDGRLAAIIAAGIGVYVLLSDGVAWLIYGIVHFVQNRRK